MEAERDRLAAVVERYQRREVEQLAAEHLADGSDLWRGDVQLADVLDDDGTVDADRVRDAAQRVVTDKPHWSNRRTPKPDPSQGARGGVPTPQRLGAIFTQTQQRR